MSSLPPELRHLTTDLAEQDGLPSNAVAEIEQAIQSSRYLTHLMNSAVEKGYVQHLRFSSPDTNASGYYDSRERAIYISPKSFEQDGIDPEQLRDSLVATLGHETSHAFDHEHMRQATHRLLANIEKEIRQAGPSGTADLTESFDRYIKAARWGEATAEATGWNALADRVRTQRGNDFEPDDVLKRAGAVAASPCIEPVTDDEYRLASGIELDTKGRIPSDNREAVAQCFFDSREQGLGAQGQSDYRNYYGALGFKEIARVVDKWQNPPDIHIDTARLGFDKAMLESNGLNLGAEGRAFTFTDPKTGWVTLQHTHDGTSKGTPDPQMPADTELRMAPSSPFDTPTHPDHALYAELKERLPQASEDRLAQFTAACHTHGIKPGQLGNIYAPDADRITFMPDRSAVGTMAEVSLTAPPPPTTDSLEQVERHDRQRAQELEQQRTSAQEQQQAPAMGL